jgi:hypothetical protein
MASGELALARGDVGAAVEHLQAARVLWAELDAPYELARTCVLLGRALSADGDPLSATLELEAARGIFERLGAERDRSACAALLQELGPVGSPRPDAKASPSRSASFVREGELWSVAFDGTTVRLKEGKGPAYVARLLAEPGREMLALELASDGSGALPTGDAGEVLDAAARSAYRTRLAELQSELDEATANDDLGRVERHRSEIDALTRELAAAVGLGGRARRAGDPNERARQSVTKAIRATIKRLADEHEPLGRYLSNTIRTGVACSFDPDPGRPVDWRVER